jgi:hypothetical protein
MKARLFLLGVTAVAIVATVMLSIHAKQLETPRPAVAPHPVVSTAPAMA